MITGELKNKIDGLWDIFASGGLVNPLDVIEQITYLMFIHDLDETDNRRAKDGLAADVVMGPIANDTIFDTLGIMSSGYLEPADALALLMIGPEYTQVAIKTETALEHLHFIGSERIEKISADQLKEEQEAFQEAFSQGIERIMGE